MNPILSLRRRLLRLPLFYKILLANSAVVGLGAAAGTIITVWHVRSYPDDIHYELIAFFAGAGIVISFLVNRWLLKRTLEPLARLQEAVDLVRQGRSDVRVSLGHVSDGQFDRLAETFNRMLVEHERHAEQMQQLVLPLANQRLGNDEEDALRPFGPALRDD